MRKKIARAYSWWVRLAKGYVLGDTFERAAFRWFRDNGDATVRLAYPLSGDSVVFDCGGYEGEWAAAIHKRYGSKLYVFEPVQEFYQTIRNRFVGFDSVQIFPFGLHACNEVVTIRVDAAASSVFGVRGPEQSIELRDVQEFVRAAGIRRIDLMKINIEGGEFALLDRMLATGLVALIENLQIQFHRFVPNAVARRDQIRKLLAQTHHLTFDYEFIWENWEKGR